MSPEEIIYSQILYLNTRTRNISAKLSRLEFNGDGQNIFLKKMSISAKRCETICKKFITYEQYKSIINTIWELKMSRKHPANTFKDIQISRDEVLQIINHHL